LDDSALHLIDEEIRTLGEGGVVVREGFIGRDAAIRIAGVLGGIPLRAAGMVGGVNRELRGDDIGWLDNETAPELHGEARRAPPDEGWNPLIDRFEQLRLELNRKAYLGLSRMDVQLARYPGGGARYDRHLDAVAGRTHNRRVTAIWYANIDWQPTHGGTLRVHTPAPRDIEPILDRLVLFLSEKVEHEVLPAHAPRLAVTAWYY
jgi:SM-20-related protein